MGIIFEGPLVIRFRQKRSQRVYSVMKFNFPESGKQENDYKVVKRLFPFSGRVSRDEMWSWR